VEATEDDFDDDDEFDDDSIGDMQEWSPKEWNLGLAAVEAESASICLWDCGIGYDDDDHDGEWRPTKSGTSQGEPVTKWALAELDSNTLSVGRRLWLVTIPRALCKVLLAKSKGKPPLFGHVVHKS
jgi:hypothetical protein